MIFSLTVSSFNIRRERELGDNGVSPDVGILMLSCDWGVYWIYLAASASKSPIFSVAGFITGLACNALSLVAPLESQGRVICLIYGRPDIES
jgi:hypothetical protein